MAIKIQGYEIKFYDIRYPAVCLNLFLTLSSWVCTLDSYILEKPMKISLIYCYWLASLSLRSFAMAIKMQGYERKFFDIRYPPVCLNPFWPWFLEFALLISIFLETSWKVVLILLLACILKAQELCNDNKDSGLWEKILLYPAVWLNPFWPWVLKFTPFILIFLESHEN